MPKQVKNKLRKLPTPPKPQRPSDPNRAAHNIIAEHMERVQDLPPSPALDFDTLYKARMAELGAKGGKVSGAKRMEMPAAKRRAIAKKGAAARWKKGQS